MGEPTMEEYMTRTRNGYGSGIARPKINEKALFELKGQFLKELHDNTFSGSDNEDDNEHIEKVLEERFKELLLRFPQYYLTDMQELLMRRKPSKTWMIILKNDTMERLLGGQYKAAAPGFYQRNNGNPSYQERRLTMEESLSKFMVEYAKRHKENSNLIKEIRASMDAAIRNQGASIKALE
ncbi:hypothetical protein Tco_1500663 [Tanacetum coccineum]